MNPESNVHTYILLVACSSFHNRPLMCHLIDF